MDLNGFKQQIDALSLEEKVEVCKYLTEEIKKESGTNYGSGVGLIANCEDVNIVNCLSASDLADIFEALAQKTRKEKPFAE
ncbi:MAG: hypothetical protein J7647_31170 [Cyanobacteria bacterium SBLK]|nr:hypothetical protein [Cyanobacteria bacterium SBLK]